MPASTATRVDVPSGPRWGWVNVFVAALLMLATLPGRTQGLGLITEPLLKDLQIDRVSFATINLWATLLGATFCFPAGYLIDRVGLRLISSGIVLLLGGVVWKMRVLQSRTAELLGLLLRTRGLVQIAFAVASITTLGKSFGQRTGLAMGVFSFLLTVFFSIAFIVVGGLVSSKGWRVAWTYVADFLAFVVTPATILFLRENSPPSGPRQSESLSL